MTIFFVSLHPAFIKQLQINQIELMKQSTSALHRELERVCIDNKNNFARILHQLKREFDEWSMDHLSKDGFFDMKMGYMAFLMNISSDGITNNDLAKKIRVTKQAMSKTLKELENLDLVELKPNPNDARSSLILLTEYGMKTVIHCRQKVSGLTEVYKKTIGAKKYKEMLESLTAIIEIHQSMKL